MISSSQITTFTHNRGTVPTRQAATGHNTCHHQSIHINLSRRSSKRKLGNKKKGELIKWFHVFSSIGIEIHQTVKNSLNRGYDEGFQSCDRTP
ncbi:hypothetical protein YC2023_107018 [Brassica napus]